MLRIWSSKFICQLSPSKYCLENQLIINRKISRLNNHQHVNRPKDICYHGFTKTYFTSSTNLNMLLHNRHIATKSTLSEEEVEKFRKLSDSWWEVNGGFKALHAMNFLRVALIRDTLLKSASSSSTDAALRSPTPLAGFNILDVGCGGGILCEALARLGASVTGIDAVEENVTAASKHALQDGRVAPNVRYIHGTIEEHVQSHESLYDVVVASEVVEHVESVEFFLSTCSLLVRPGGSFIVTTINKTNSSWLVAILIGEYLLRIIPVGTHDWHKFLSPEELSDLLKKSGCRTKFVKGMFYNPCSNQWSWTNNTSVSYALHSVKE